MTVIVFLLCLSALISSLFLFFSWLLTTSFGQESFQTIKNGFHAAMFHCGLTAKHPPYEVELYIWEPGDNVVCRQCDVCQERAEWAPMDIADWMAEGLPGTAETECSCGEHCQCRLVNYNPALHGYYYEEQA